MRIVPLGDSITHGNGGRSYRYPLWRKLLDAGVEFDFVGTLNNQDSVPTYPPQPFDGDHQGHPAYRCADIRNVVSFLRNANPHPYTPDIALLHAGTNDVFHAQQPSDTYAELVLLIAELRLWNPQITVFLGRLIPHYSFLDGGANNARINAINALIDADAGSLDTPTSRVIVVDQNTGFIADPGVYPTYGGDTTDGAHPSPSGEEKMAQRWADALLPMVVNPALTQVGVGSSNSNPSLAKTGDTITVNFTANKPLQAPTATIAGRPATVADLGGNTWSASLAVEPADLQGTVLFSLAYADLYGRSGPAVSSVTDGSAVTIDTIAPVVSIAGGPAIATTADLLQVSGLATDVVGLASVAWANDRGGSGVAVGTASWSIAAVPLLHGANLLTVTAIDSAGNSGAATLTVTRQAIHEAWAAEQGLEDEDALLSADADTDGFVNLLEFAYGMNPTVATSGEIEVTSGTITRYGPPRMEISDSAMGVAIRVIFGQRKDRVAAGLNYAVQFSPDLTTWVTSEAVPTVLAEDEGAKMEAVSVPFPFFINGRKARFSRIVITGP